MNKILEQLKIDFSVTASTENSANGSVRITFLSNWKGTTEGVRSVVVYLTGRNPLTGEEIDESKLSYRFTAVDTKFKTGVLRLSGKYLLHYDAELLNGEIVKNFRDPTLLELNSSEGNPYIKYSTISAPNGWTGLRIESNCWKRCSGKIWAKYLGHCQLLPKFYEEIMECFLPIINKEFELFSIDSSLPTIQKKQETR